MYILGISAFYHDSSACLIHDGNVIAGVAEERYTRKKHDYSFPTNAINFCLNHKNLNINDLDAIVFYEKPLVKFDRIMSTFAQTTPHGWKNFIHGMPDWIKNRLWTRNYIKKKLNYNGIIYFTDHHESHAASSYFMSPFNESAILTLDGIGEWTSTTIGYGKDNKIVLLKEIHFPHSLGLLYSTFTSYLGFKVNSGEYKVMGASAYGKPKYYDTIMRNLIDVKLDGSYSLNMDFFNYLYSDQMFNERFDALFNYIRKEPETEMTQDHFDLAASIQKVTENIILNILENLDNIIDTPNLCLSGGVALNSLCNKRIIEESSFKNLYVHPDAGDGGGSLGAAKFVYHHVLGNKKVPQNFSPYIGREYSDNRIRDVLICNNLRYNYFTEVDKNQNIDIHYIAKQLSKGKIIALFHGRMEWGPRALGNRSIIADPRDPNMKDKINKSIKYREQFRPFAPTVLYEYWKDYFEIKGNNEEYPYMLVVADVKEDKKSIIPAVTHVDGTARIQTLKRDQNPFYYDIIREFYNITNIPVVLNTSFNVRGEPIVNTPQDAINTFNKSGIDILIMGNYMINKNE